MERELNRKYLGKGWSFPPSFDPYKGEVKLVSEEEDIEQSLEILLGTRPGERELLPNFGCNLDVMLFEPLTTTLITEVSDIIRTAILYHEPRIDVSKININQIDDQTGMILIEIDYRVRSTNSRFNFVYPFYLEEGSIGQQIVRSARGQRR
ncbi:MAG: GPW/gp25 family protein [Bacteroidota bacterium]